MHSIRWIFVLCLGYFMTIEARIHQPVIRDDDRRHIRLTSFGYKEGGFLQIHITGFNVTNPPTTNSSTTQFGFTLEKMGNDAIDSYMITYRDKCLLDDESTLIQYNYNVTFFSMDFKNKIVRVNCGEQSSMAKLHLYNDMPAIKSNNDGLPTDELSPNSQSRNQISILLTNRVLCSVFHLSCNPKIEKS